MDAQADRDARNESGRDAALVAGVLAGFEDRFGGSPDLVGRAPGRVNLIGEHTDYNQGLCLPIALPQATVAGVRATTDGSITLASASYPEPWTGRLDDLAAGSVSGWAAYPAGVLWALRQEGWEVPGIELYVDSEVPTGAGLSSSAALECSVAIALAALAGRPDDEETRQALIRASIRAETEMAGAPTGGLDQTAALLARADAALRLDFQDGSVTPVPLPLAEAGLGVLVVDTRVSHALTDGGYGSRVAECRKAAEALGVGTLRDADLGQVNGLADPLLQRRARHVVTEIARVDEAVAAVEAGDWARLGALFLASHASMRDDYEISVPELDTVVRVATDAGALGARMTGGGFGGSAIALVPLDHVDAVSAAVLAAFSAQGYREPAMLLVDPGPAASLIS